MVDIEADVALLSRKIDDLSEWIQDLDKRTGGLERDVPSVLEATLRLKRLEQAVEFILKSTMVTMNIPSSLINPATNQPQLTQVTGPLLSFFHKALEHGKDSLQTLTADDVRDALVSSND